MESLLDDLKIEGDLLLDEEEVVDTLPNPDGFFANEHDVSTNFSNN